MKHNKISYVYALLAALLWGSTAAVVKLLGIHLNSLQILFYCSAIATVSLLIIAAVQGKLSSIRIYKTKDYIRFSYMSFLGVFIYYVLLYTALQKVPGQEAFVVNYTWPIWVIIFAALILKENFTWKKFVAVVLGFFGVLIVVSKGDVLGLDVSALQGNVLALLAAVSYGLFSALSKRHNEDKVLATMFYYIFSFLYVGLFVVFFSSIPLPSIKEFVGLLWLGVFTNGIAFILWQLALKHRDTGKMSNIIFITPFSSLMYLYVLTNEKILVSSIVGVVMIVSGIALQSYRKSKTTIA